MQPERSSHIHRPVDHSVAPETQLLRASTLELLDFHVIRQRLAEHTTFPLARQLALRLTPSYDIQEILALHRETAEGRLLLERTGDVSMRTAADASPAVTRAALGGVLTGMDLLGVADSLEVHHRARVAVRRAGRTGHGLPPLPLLEGIAEAIPELDEMGTQVRIRIGSRGDVVDDATPSLGAMRRRVKQAYERVTQALMRIIQSPAGKEALQDQVVSVRGDRLVVQVKAEMRHRIPGIVHDASNTGATLFVEPFATVEMCNTWREWSLEEEREVAGVLRELSTLVGAVADDIRLGNDLVARLDLILARARYSAAIGGVSAIPRGPWQDNQAISRVSGTTVRLVNARHPMLGDGAVPINVNLGPGWSVLVITGPNMGGKTVTMKTMGLLALMHQSGLHIPADEGSSLPVFDGVYADVGDQQSIEESVSTFSSHVLNTVNILAAAGPASLVLLDELGTSTDPEEGSALAKAILEHLSSRSIPTVATTHHRTVAAHAQATPGMMNASVELDPSTLQPTFRLTMGVPGRSYAMAVASRLGLPDKIMEKAQAMLEPQFRRFEDWLGELQNERRQLQAGVQEAQQARLEAETVRDGLKAQLEYLVSHRQDILDGTRRGLLARYEDAMRKLRHAEAALSWAPGQTTGVEESKAALSKAKEELDTQKTRSISPPASVPSQHLAAGSQVHVRGLNLRGTVASLSEAGGQAEVNIGSARLRIDVDRLSPAEPVPEAQHPDVHISLEPSLESSELDLRGLRAGEAVIRLEEFLDKAFRDGFSSVRVIHGRGTGALRQVVRERLARHQLASSFSTASPEHGGNGATVVELA